MSTNPSACAGIVATSPPVCGSVETAWKPAPTRRMRRPPSGGAPFRLRPATHSAVPGHTADTPLVVVGAPPPEPPEPLPELAPVVAAGTVSIGPPQAASASASGTVARRSVGRFVVIGGLLGIRAGRAVFAGETPGRLVCGPALSGRSGRRRAGARRGGAGRGRRRAHVLRLELG